MAQVGTAQAVKFHFPCLVCFRPVSNTLEGIADFLFCECSIRCHKSFAGGLVVAPHWVVFVTRAGVNLNGFHVAVRSRHGPLENIGIPIGAVESLNERTRGLRLHISVNRFQMLNKLRVRLFRRVLAGLALIGALRFDWLFLGFAHDCSFVAATQTALSSPANRGILDSG